MATAVQLGEFLRSRRMLLNVADVGLPDTGGRRRVAGLRREEVAELAGVSVEYYTRMEQGRVGHPSDAVLGALARALSLDSDETAHLHRIARPRAGMSWRAPAVVGPSRVRPMLRRLLASLSDVPALVMGRRLDVLASNAAAYALFGEVAGSARRGTPNVARSTFLDGTTRQLFGDWTQCARANVAYLRLEVGRHPQDHQLAALVDELSTRSVEFRRWWAEHPVADKTSGTKLLHHPLAGTLTMEYDTLRLADDPDQALVTYTPRADGRSPEALRELLAMTAGTPRAVTVLPEQVR